MLSAAIEPLSRAALFVSTMLLLGVPIIMMVKAVCDRVEDLKSVGELLGE